MTNKKENQEEKTTSQPFSNEEMDEIKKALKADIIQEMRTEKEQSVVEARQRRLAEKEKHLELVRTMKASPDPWVDIAGWVHTEAGVKVELDWNDAFVDYLRGEGLAGTDDDQVIQKWITLLLRDMTEQLTDGESSDYE